MTRKKEYVVNKRDNYLVRDVEMPLYHVPLPFPFYAILLVCFETRPGIEIEIKRKDTLVKRKQD